MRKVIVYGIPNCDTIKKTLNWLRKNKIAFEFHDYKKSGISKQKLVVWCKRAGWEVILNKKSSTWRVLDTAVKDKIINQAAAVKLMSENTSIIKRPVTESANNFLIGFNEIEYQRAFK